MNRRENHLDTSLVSIELILRQFQMEPTGRECLSGNDRKTRIDELNGKLSVLRDERIRLENETRELAEKRDKLNDRARGIRVEIQEVRMQRDEVNGKVRDMKQRRNEAMKSINAKIAEVRKAQEEYRSLLKKEPSRSHHALQKEVERIDWQIQTTPTTLKEDRELVGKVKQLETQLVVHKRLERLKDKIAELRIQTRTTRFESQQLHTQLTANAQIAQESHRKMLEKIAESKALKTQADDMHKQYLQTRAKIKPLQEEAKTIVDQILQLEGKIHADRQKEKEQSESVLRETLERQAKEKLKRGGKLSWEEFQLLAERGMTE